MREGRHFPTRVRLGIDAISDFSHALSHLLVLLYHPTSIQGTSCTYPAHPAPRGRKPAQSD